ncbi:MAG: tRNA 2-selenouridine(34) synthase MnmH [Methylococcales bacterium]|nr:tRNA 2-selenouridine(34) synthase MnmH [Methylococcales bacterium]
MIRSDTDDYQKLFIQDIPMMDVRAPVEFDKGAFPNSQNVPLLNDMQRKTVGTQYKQEGQDAAIALGLKLATPEIRQQRLKHWEQFVNTYPEGYLYCFRGGLRSRTTQSWLKEQGVNYPLIKGGYKAMRTYLLQQLDVSWQQVPLVILSGFTGSGKTRVLKKTRYHLDLEGLANHRGSAFGSDIHDFQPSQINWENQLSIASLKHRHQLPDSGLLLEDEGKRIGRIIMPEGLIQKMSQAPIIFLERELEQRIEIIREDYITHNWPFYQQYYPETANEKFSYFVLDSLGRIKKRLGGTRYKKINALFIQALDHLFETGNSCFFDEGIRLLLLEYYDPMYQYQLQKKQSKILFRGTKSEILAWADEHLKAMKQ